MQRHPWRRLIAWLVDWVCVLVWVAVVAAVGIPLYVAGVLPPLDTIVANAVSAFVLVGPVTLGLAALESSRLEGTLGKRMLGLRVSRRAGGRMSFGSALLRNSLKVALPWLIGHAAVYAIVWSSSTGSVAPWVWMLTLAAYLLPLVYIVSLFVHHGRTPYDAAGGTTVVVAD